MNEIDSTRERGTSLEPVHIDSAVLKEETITSSKKLDA